MEFGRGGACVPARVDPQWRIHRSIPRAQCVCFWYGNAAARTFGRARRRRPYAFCLRELRVDGGLRVGGLRVEWLVAFEKEIWSSAIFSVLAFHPRVNTILLLHATG